MSSHALARTLGVYEESLSPPPKPGLRKGHTSRLRPVSLEALPTEMPSWSTQMPRAVSSARSGPQDSRGQLTQLLLHKLLDARHVPDVHGIQLDLLLPNSKVHRNAEVVQEHTDDIQQRLVLGQHAPHLLHSGLLAKLPWLCKPISPEQSVDDLDSQSLHLVHQCLRLLNFVGQPQLLRVWQNVAASLRSGLAGFALRQGCVGVLGKLDQEASPRGSLWSQLEDESILAQKLGELQLLEARILPQLRDPGVGAQLRHRDRLPLRRAELHRAEERAHELILALLARVRLHPPALRRRLGEALHFAEQLAGLGERDHLVARRVVPEREELGLVPERAPHQRLVVRGVGRAEGRPSGHGPGLHAEWVRLHTTRRRQQGEEPGLLLGNAPEQLPQLQEERILQHWSDGPQLARCGIALGRLAHLLRAEGHDLALLRQHHQQACGVVGVPVQYDAREPVDAGVDEVADLDPAPSAVLAQLRRSVQDGVRVKQHNILKLQGLDVPGAEVDVEAPFGR
mmetsp:Transcript_163335/g.523710  ORF Transcript_163335/g.523710 Transcript_163335/m.523710 type:complete len:511 (-) Transcript_163335:372-1904(-)